MNKATHTGFGPLERKDAGDIDAKEIAKAIDGLNTGFEEFKKANDERLGEIEKKGSADPILEEKLEKIQDDMDKHQKVLGDVQLAMKRQKRIVVDQDGNEIDMDKKAAEWAEQVKLKNADDFTGDKLVEYKGHYMSYLRNGDRLMEADELKALSVGSDPDGGYTVHPDMSGAVVGFIRETSPMRAYANVQAISTDALEGVYDLDEAGSGWVGETGSRTETDTPEIGRWRIPVHEMYAAPKATQKLLDDSAIDPEAWLAGKVGDKFARTEAAAFVNGSGSNQPRGFLTYDDWTTAGTFENGKIEQFNTGVNGNFAAAPNGGDVLIDALYGLKAQYRANASWFMNRATTKLVRKLKDSDGAYLWQPGIAAGQPASVLGYSTASFEDMPDPATNSLSIAVGDMRATYTIVDRVGIRVLRDPYTSKPYVIFYSTKRVGGDVNNFDSLKIIKFAA